MKRSFKVLVVVFAVLTALAVASPSLAWRGHQGWGWGPRVSLGWGVPYYAYPYYPYPYYPPAYGYPYYTYPYYPPSREYAYYPHAYSYYRYYPYAPYYYDYGPPN